jgi:transposase
MALGRQKDRQGDLMVDWSEMPRSSGHVFYDRLQSVLIKGGFDGFAEAACRPYYAAKMGAPSVPPGRYFRMHLVDYFEGIDSGRGLEWRCSDSPSLREFLRLESRARVPDHSWLSKTRTRLPHEIYAAVFDWVLALIAEAGLIKGERISADGSTMEANAALRTIVRREPGETDLRDLAPALMEEARLSRLTGDAARRVEGLAAAHPRKTVEESQIEETGSWEFTSARDPSQVYQVTYGRAGHLECTCKGFEFRGNCKHVREVRETVA